MRSILIGIKGHPGNYILLAILGLGFISGGWFGVFITACAFGPIYLYGAWERGRIKRGMKP